MKANGRWLRRTAAVAAMAAWAWGATAAHAVTLSNFKVSVTGLAVVEDYRVYYDTAALQKVVFSAPKTRLVVPKGSAVLARIAYDFPAGYGVQLWAGCDGDTYCNPSGCHYGKGTAYGFFGISEPWEDRLSTRVTVMAGVCLTNGGDRIEWESCSVPAQLLFKGSNGGTAAVLTLGADSRNFTADATSGKELGVTANVSWTAKSGASWLTLKTAAGSGNGKVVYNVAANTGMSARTGTLTVSGGGVTRTFTVTQSGKAGGGSAGGSGGGGGTAAALTLSAYERAFGCGAASGKELGVTANVGWTAKASVSWVTVNTKSGKGSGKVTYDVAANPNATPRTGKITVSGGGKTAVFTITQEKKAIVLQVSTSSREFGCGAASGKELGVTANVRWTAKSSVSWVKLQKGSGSGNGKVAYDVAANPNATPRTGKITVSGGGKTAVCTIRQAEKTTVLEVTPAERAFGSGAQNSKEFKVTANVSWTAKPSEPWIKVGTQSGNGSGKIVYTVTQNPGAKRTAAITVNGGGKTVKVRIVQDAAKRANKKFALCVGINTYLSGHATLKGAKNDAVHFANNLANRGGGWSSSTIWRYTDYNAKKKTIRAALASIAAQTIPGDTFVCFVASHGGASGGRYCLCTTDDDYWDTEFASDLGQFPSGVKVVVILDTCHSGGMIRKTKNGTQFPFAERVSGILDAELGSTSPRGARGFVNKIRSSEIGWVTAASPWTSSYEGGYYDTGDWLESGKTGQEKGGTFTAAFTWGWWYGEADAEGDGDRQFDAYEGYCFAAPHCKSDPMCHNPGVLRSVELGSCGRANLAFYRPAGWPAAVFVTTYETYTSQKTSFTAAGNAKPCVRYAWYNDSRYKVTSTGTAARPYKVRWAVSGPETAVYDDPANSLMPWTYVKEHYYYGLANYNGVYAAPSRAGTYRVTITLDSENDVSESNEGDNTASVTFTVLASRGGAKPRKEGEGIGTKTGGESEAVRGVAGPEEDSAETASGLEGGWVAVTTSDGEDGGVVLDGDEGTGWGPAGSNGGWVALSYSEEIDVKSVEVKGEGLPEEGMRVLVSEDADEWREECEGRAQYVWVILPEGAEGARVTEIVVDER